MDGYQNILFLGGDRRQYAMMREMFRMGYRISAWGLHMLTSMPFVQTVTNPIDALPAADAVILPLPASSDGVRIFAPEMQAEEGVRVDTLLSHLSGKLCLGGRLSTSFARKGANCIDYYEDETLQVKNALPTAEGAVLIAMQQLPTVLFGTSIAVIGYGRIGALLAERLHAWGADVTVYARREEVLARACFAGCRTVKLEPDAMSAAEAITKNATRVIFNTVPKILFSERELQRLPADILYIELASLPGGIDFDAARKRGISTVWGSALPGKYAPESAGIYLAQTVHGILKREAASPSD